MASSAKMSLFRMDRATFLSFSVCVFYGGCSLLMGLLNKALLSSYNFNGIFMLLAAQMALQLALCSISRDYFGNPFKVPQYDRATHRQGVNLGISYVLNVGMGLIALSMVNLPMFFCIRRLVSPTILVYEWAALGKAAEPAVQGAVGTIMFGALVAGWDTLSVDIVGYGLTLLNNFTTAGASVMQKQFSDATKLGALGTLYYNAMTALPLAAVLSIVTGEISALSAFPYANDSKFWASFVVACALGPLLTYSSMLCTTYNSPLAMSITGNVKDMASTVLGAVLFPGFVATVKNVGGLLLTFVGAGVYSYISLKKGMAAATAAKGSALAEKSAAAGAGAAAPALADKGGNPGAAAGLGAGGSGAGSREGSPVPQPSVGASSATVAFGGSTGTVMQRSAGGRSVYGSDGSTGAASGSDAEGAV